jgi:acetylornithine deacetylase/succinyl-diaminopimelate desuccinylase-like protein
MQRHRHADQVLAQIHEDEVVELAVALGDIDSPAGDEGRAAAFVYEWMTREGFAPQRIGLFPDRPNVIGRLPGSGGGCSLLFNSHLDTSVAEGELWSTRHAADPIYHRAWREGPVLRGNGVCNDKGQMACWLIAAKAVKDAAPRLAGDILLTAVAGEIELEPVDEYAAPAYASREGGTRYAIGHGAVADFALVAEATDFNVGWVEAGSAFFKISALGAEPPQYNPFVTGRGVESPNAIVHLARSVEVLERWAPDYERRHVYRCAGGTVVPRIGIGAIRGGLPYKITKTAQVASLYLDARLTPVQSPLEVREELRALLAPVLPGLEIDLYAYRRGYEAEGVDPLVSAIERAHGEIRGGALEGARPVITSMWRDLNPFVEAGIPCVMYGPGPTTGTGVMGIAVEDLVAASRAYALLALDIASTPRTAAAGADFQPQGGTHQ